MKKNFLFSLGMACLVLKNAQCFHFPEAVRRPPLTCLVLIRREWNNGRIGQ